MVPKKMSKPVKIRTSRVRVAKDNSENYSIFAKIRDLFLRPHDFFVRVRTESIGKSLFSIAIIAFMGWIIMVAGLNFTIWVVDLVYNQTVPGFAEDPFVLIFIHLETIALLALIPLTLIACLFVHGIVKFCGGVKGFFITYRTCAYALTPVLLAQAVYGILFFIDIQAVIAFYPIFYLLPLAYCIYLELLAFDDLMHQKE